MLVESGVILHRRAVLVAIAVSALACRHGARARDGATHTVLSLRGIDCESCGARIIAALKRQPGVYELAFDRKKAEVTVVHAPAAMGLTKLLATVRSTDIDVVLGAGQGTYLPPAKYPAGADVRTISAAGESVELQDHVVAGKVTVFDFFAAWCRPCREVDAHLVAVLGGRDDVAVRKLDVVDWDTPLAQRYLAEVPTLPYVVVYDRRGRPIAAIAGLDLVAIDRALDQGVG